MKPAPSPAGPLCLSCLKKPDDCRCPLKPAPSPAERCASGLERAIREKETHSWCGNKACDLLWTEANEAVREIAALRAALAERGRDLVDAADSLFKAVARADAAVARVKTLTKENERLRRERRKAADALKEKP